MEQFYVKITMKRQIIDVEHFDYKAEVVKFVNNIPIDFMKFSNVKILTLEEKNMGDMDWDSEIILHLSNLGIVTIGSRDRESDLDLLSILSDIEIGPSRIKLVIRGEIWNT